MAMSTAAVLEGQELISSKNKNKSLLLLATAAAGGGVLMTFCEDEPPRKKQALTPADVAKTDMEDFFRDTLHEEKAARKSKTKQGDDSEESNNNIEDEEDYDDDYEDPLAKMPEYTLDQVAENNGEDGKPIWMSYGGVVYDVTDFIPNHPGGAEKILTAAGSAIEPFWYMYRQHFASDLPIRLMERMAIGRLAEADQEAVDEQMSELESGEDPYDKEPMRHSSLIVHSDTPMNAETPSHLLTTQYLTSTALFFIRHHHPVPYLTPQEIQRFALEIDLSKYDPALGVVKLSLDDLKKCAPKTYVTSTLQCSGNRRSGFNKFDRTSGTSWGQGAISTAKWGGVRLLDVLRHAGVREKDLFEPPFGLEHVRFFALDGMSASIGWEKATNPYGDVLICWEMNGEPLPRDHGFPLRIIVPGYAAVRNVKWLHKIELAKEEAEGPWQRGLNYKTLPPSVTDAKNVKLEYMPSMTEASLFSGITSVKRSIPSQGSETNTTKKLKPGDIVRVDAKGWAWAGGGRNIVRVDITGDGGASWETATLTKGANQRFGRAWAWTFWQCRNIPAVVQDNGTIQLASKAVDLAFNVQPESCQPTWNVRGLGNNSWYRIGLPVITEEEDEVVPMTEDEAILKAAAA